MRRFFEYSASPLYAQVADAMRERIVKGIWPIGSRIPTLPALAEEFGVASITIRQSVQLLKNEGLLQPEQGRGTFVRAKPQTHPRMQVESSLTKLADLYRELAPRLIPISEGTAMPRLDPEDGLPAPKYRYLHRIHASDRQLTSVISAYIDERIFKLAAGGFRDGTVALKRRCSQRAAFALPGGFAVLICRPSFPVLGDRQQAELRRKSAAEPRQGSKPGKSTERGYNVSLKQA